VYTELKVNSGDISINASINTCTLIYTWVKKYYTISKIIKRI